MKLERYQLKTSNNIKVFEFVSEGPKGRIEKIIQFSETNLKGFYNLAFGDINPVTGKLDDEAISNNGDMDKILATIVAAVLAFTERNPDAYVYATGSTSARTRIYRMGISKYYEEIVDSFQLFGETENDLETFEKNKDYDGFVVIRKSIKIYIMKIKEINKGKTPIIPIDKSLDKYEDSILFPKKLEKANEMLRKIGLPKIKKAL